MGRKRICFRVDHDRRWRPRGRGPVCGYAFRGKTCQKSGSHYCEPRADRVVAFFAELLVHTKGPHKRKPFLLRPWQEHEIIRPLFGEVVWSREWGCYVRRFRVAYIVVARKNGKSELAAGILLYLLVGDDEEAAEVYSAAKDTKQAGKVFEPALRMVQLSPELTKLVKHNKNARRLIYERTASYYEIITADAAGELGHNPHGFNLDEVLAQPDGSLWEAMTTAAGARLQELMSATTTETNDGASFGAELINEAERVVEDPKRAPHVFAFVRKQPANPDQLDRLRRLFKGHPDLPVSLDPFDEANWKWPNPALDDFLSRDALRRDALTARNEPAKLNSFLQFRLNRRVQQKTRFVAMDLWDANLGEVAPNPGWLLPKLEGQACSAGLDLSSKLDLTAWCLLFDDGWCWWRFWVPESVVPSLDKGTGGQFGLWVRDGWVAATEGDVIDYDVVYGDIEADCRRFTVADGQYDRWSGEPVRQEIKKRTGLDLLESETTYARMTPALKEFMRLLKGRELAHGGNPVARWMADNLEVRSPRDNPEMLRPVKPNRDASDKRIDGMPALLFAVNARVDRLQLRGPSVGVW
ncbi:MAG: terminase large subunit [Actinomycetota bacterium]|nr:terminase large subunit [Actinomycetota bacterium]